MSPKLHAAAGALGLTLIATFWTSTVLVETLGTPTQVAAVKQAILYALALLIPSLALAGAGGARLARSHRGPVVATKTRRMRLAALNGVLILVPSAVFLASKAGAGALDTGFYAVQALELMAGAANFALLSANMRDGMALVRRRQPVR
ncbi:putative transmembrane protein [Rhodovulum sp. P5]|uniref:hypothetical protein n=1 Tax=Rhodovulum sp. P5 TaxID=1564506 RepID=UPI0009C2F783|nr:hypothetical protein [Rhodovulum sp. P5]ARE39354.1 putative transmembrane protein [Rhodovulum sp. P5]